MDIKTLLRKSEKPILYSYLGLWLLVYLGSRFFLVMYTDYGPPSFWKWAAVVIIPFAIYAALRTVFSKAEKWYGFIGYFLIYTIGGIVASEYMVVNGDILISAALKNSQVIEVQVLDVHKVFKRKIGFDHTAVTVLNGKKKITMEARPYAYFYLWDKKKIRVSLASSNLGNDYVTSVGLGHGEKIYARWLHLKDMAYRMRLLWGILLCMIMVAWIGIRYFPHKSADKPVRYGFWKIMGIVMGILFGLGLLCYAGLWLYFIFFRA